jgi:hypothetical protein
MRIVLIGVKAAGRIPCYQIAAMNDFLRACNCVHPAEEECEKCIEDAAAPRPAAGSDDKAQRKADPKAAPAKKKA